MTTIHASRTGFNLSWRGFLKFLLGWLACTLLFAVGLVVLAFFISFGTWFYAVHAGQAYADPQTALAAKIDQTFTGVERYEVRSMGPNDYQGKQPGVWFVGADVWASGRTDGRELSQRGFESIGRFLVLTKRGWVFMEEHSWPPLWGSPAD